MSHFCLADNIPGADSSKRRSNFCLAALSAGIPGGAGIVSEAGEVVGAWGNSGDFGAAIPHLAHSLRLPVCRSTEKGWRFEEAQGSARAHRPRERGNIQATKEDPAKVVWGHLIQCVSGRLLEFADRMEPKSAGETAR